MTQQPMQTSPVVVIDARSQADVSVSFCTLSLTWCLSSFPGKSLVYLMKTDNKEIIYACDPLLPVVSVTHSRKSITSLLYMLEGGISIVPRYRGVTWNYRNTIGCGAQGFSSAKTGYSASSKTAPEGRRKLSWKLNLWRGYGPFIMSDARTKGQYATVWPVGILRVTGSVHSF